MEIAQTLWLDSNSINTNLKNPGGWLSAEYHWLSWALSSQQLAKFYHKTSIHTTQAGKEILIDLFYLPYKYVKCSLEHVDI